MDVRCEKCLTVYEFDESQVGDQGVTVKCTQCGNLFKVKRRSTTAEMAYGAATRAPKTTNRGIPVGPPPAAEASAQRNPAAPAPRAETEWMLRRASNGKIFRFREIASLRQLVLEGKLVREDEVSPDGETWQTLGEIPDLTHDFIAATAQSPQAGVTQALGNLAPPPPAPPPRAPAPSPRNKVTAKGPSFANEPPEQPVRRQRSQTPVPAFGAAEGPSMGLGLTLPDDHEQSFASRLPRRSNTPIFIAAAAVLALTVGGLLWWRHASAPTTSQGLDQAAMLFAADTDDAFRQATTLLRQVSPDGPDHVAALALTADIEATWAFHLREDARGLEAAGGAAAMAARTLRTEADVHLADAKRAANEAIGASADNLAAMRAMADVLTVQGATATEVEQSLKRVLDKQPGDPQSVYIGGVLSYREGRLDDARLRLNQANQLQLATTQRPLVRALFLDGTILAALGRAPEARQSLNGVLAASPQHERARTLLQLLDAAATKAPPPAPVASSAPTVAAPPAAVPAATTGSGGAGAEPTGDYAHLVATADRAAENGHSDQARKVYERALVLNPRGIEAITGLGYCDLDQEHFRSAVDRFRHALEIAPEHGEALIGMAEAYKVRGDRAQALDYYKRYLKAQPGGPKADMAQKNIRDLEPHAAVTTETTTTPVDSKGHANGPTTTTETGTDKLPPPPPAPDDTTKTVAKPEPTRTEPTKTEKADPPSEAALPHLPAN